MDYLSTTEYQSKIVPEAKFLLRKVSHARRLKWDLDAAVVLAKIYDLQRQASPVYDDISKSEEAARIEPCTCGDKSHAHNEETKQCLVPNCGCREPKPDPQLGGYSKIVEIQSKIMTIVMDELHPLYIRWGVKSIEGMTIDKEPATVDSLIESGPEALVAEIGNYISSVMKWSQDEILGFKLPITSGAQVGGQTKSSTAPSASEISTTSTVSA